MTIELKMLVCSAILGLVHVVLQAAPAAMTYGLPWAMGSRDDARGPPTVMAARLDRALRNFLETFPLFVAAVFVAHEMNRHNGLTVWGTELYFFGRLAYLPLYAFGVMYARSLAWTVAVVGIVLVLVGLT
jgi:uncharacterized MAPEG superfamily protein